MIFKRYEYLSNEGKKWTNWFPWNSDYKPEYQLNKKLKNEYKESICSSD